MNVRPDLLALTPDDLASLTNRGTVKRAWREMEDGQLNCTIEDHAGDLVFQWSDGIQCRFPAGKTVHDAVCSSGTIGNSRHVIRSVLAYQRVQADQRELASQQEQQRAATPDSRDHQHASSPIAGPSGTTAGAITSGAITSGAITPAATNAPWNPGDITDDVLLERFRKPALAQARRRYEQGLLVELTRGAKPVARFLDEGLTVRFLVPDDLRYVSADCAESLLPTWVPLAVWAFRELPPDRIGGLLSIQEAELTIPRQPLETLAELLGEFCREGLHAVSSSWAARIARLEVQLREAGLIWPAELVLDLLHQHELYLQHDARFEPQQLVRIAGELEVRRRAILSGTRAVPQLLVRGSRSDRTTDIAGGRLIGVGLEIVPGTRQTKIRSYLQDADSGSLMAVERTFSNPDPKTGETPRSFADLADTVLVRGISLRGLASSQLLLKSGKRTPAGELILPRTASSMTLHPQAYEWETLKPPFAAENMAQLRSRFESLPPDCLLPRRCTANLHVLAVQEVAAAHFDQSRQCLLATVVDANGEHVQLRHRYHSRGRQGFNDLCRIFEQGKWQIRFVSGHVRTAGSGLVIEPLAIVFDDGTRRIGVQPWLPITDSSAAHDDESPAAGAQRARGTLPEFFSRLEHELSELLLTGAMQGNPVPWNELARAASHLGFVRFPETIEQLALTLSNRANTVSWDSQAAARLIRELCLRVCVTSSLLTHTVE